MFSAKRKDAEKHVFVTGLARAGTTVLMRALHSSGCFRSLTYRDMPFVLAPNLWKRISGAFQKDMEAGERAHGDGILVDFDSPEAFEEVFWRTICGSDYLLDDRLIPHECDDEAIEAFRVYVAQVIAIDSGVDCQRYLSKNNNNLLRLPVLKQAFPNAVILIPFRDPVKHASSLLSQHLAFSDTTRNGKFTFNYMTWLGHHEFGQTHRPFAFPQSWQGKTPNGNPTELCYWVNRWCDAYEYALANAPDDAMFVSYERLCDGSGSEFARVLEAVELSGSASPIDAEFRLAQRSPPASMADVDMERASQIYQRLDQRR